MSDETNTNTINSDLTIDEINQRIRTIQINGEYPFKHDDIFDWIIFPLDSHK